MKWRLLSISLTLSRTEIYYCTKKEHLSWTWLGGSLEYYFLPFRVQETIYERGPLEISFPLIFTFWVFVYRGSLNDINLRGFTRIGRGFQRRIGCNIWNGFLLRRSFIGSLRHWSINTINKWYVWRFRTSGDLEDAGSVDGLGASGKRSNNVLDWEYTKSKYWAWVMAWSSVTQPPIAMFVAIFLTNDLVKHSVNNA